jgi:peptide/nickel transport system permease protein
VKATFLLARLLNSLVVMAFVALLTFLVIDLAPGSYVDDLASNPQISRASLERIRSQYGLDQPFYRKFWRWGRSLAAGDLGDSFVYQRPVRQLLAERIANTVLLNLAALTLAWLGGFALGLAAAARRGSIVDWLVVGVTTTLLSTPAVVVAIVLLAFAARLGLPIGGLSPADRESVGVAARLIDLARHLLLPAIAVSAIWMSAIAQHTRAAVISALDAPHMLAARARGISRARLLLVHALREALNPLTTFFGISISGLVSASLVVEVVMAWPGIGALAYDAVLKRDIFLVVDLVQLSALMLLVGNSIGDVLLRLVDPRTAEA